MVWEGEADVTASVLLFRCNSYVNILPTKFSQCLVGCGSLFRACLNVLAIFALSNKFVESKAFITMFTLPNLLFFHF